MKIFDKLKLSLGRKKEATTSPNSDPGEPLNPSPAEAELETEDPELECPIREPETPHSADPQPSTLNSQPESDDWSPGDGPPSKSEIPHSALATPGQLSTLNPQLKQRQPTGKVGKLPKDLRNQVNQWLDDCVTYKKICSNLEKLGYPGFVHQNIQRWKDNGYQNHLREEQRRQDLIHCLEANERLGTDSNPGEKVAKATETLMNVRLYKLIDKSHDQTDEDLMGDKSKPFFTLCSTVLKVMAQHHRNARLKLDTATREQKAAIKQALTNAGFDPKVGPSKEQREAIIATVENVLGVNLDPAEIDALLAGKYPAGAPVPPPPQGRGPEGEGEGTVQTEQPAPSSTDTTSVQTAVTSSAIPQSALATPHSPNTPEYTVTKESPLDPPIIPHSANAPECTVKEEPTPTAATPCSSNDKLPLSNYQLQIPNPRPETPNSQPPAVDPWSAAAHAANPTRDAKPETPNEKQRRFPISPLAAKPPEPKQPYGTVPILDCCGAVIDWLPQKGEGSQPTFQDPIGFHNRYRETICWVHPKDPYRDRGIPEPVPRKSPILNVSGMIVGWFAGHPDALRPPSATSEPLNSRRLPRGIVAWLDERRDYFQ